MNKRQVKTVFAINTQALLPNLTFMTCMFIVKSNALIQTDFNTMIYIQILNMYRICPNIAATAFLEMFPEAKFPFILACVQLPVFHGSKNSSLSSGFRRRVMDATGFFESLLKIFKLHDVRTQDSRTHSFGCTFRYLYGV
jgi:hypothetical protein